jgi:hypothetical protein
MFIKESTIVWCITPCSPLKVNRRFGGTFRLRLEARRINLTRNQRESRWKAQFPRNVDGLSTDYTAFYTYIHNHRCENLKSYIRSFFLLFILRRYSPNLGLVLPPWNSPFHFGFVDLRQLVGLLGRVISSSQGLYLYINTEKRTHTHTHIH